MLIFESDHKLLSLSYSTCIIGLLNYRVAPHGLVAKRKITKWVNGTVRMRVLLLGHRRIDTDLHCSTSERPRVRQPCCLYMFVSSYTAARKSL